MSQKTIEELEFEETGVTRKERWKIMWASIIGYALQAAANSFPLITIYCFDFKDCFIRPIQGFEGQI